MSRPASTASRLLRLSRRSSPQTIPCRHASTQEATNEAASNAKNAAANVQSKAAAGLTKVTSSAGPAISGAAQGVSKALSRVGGRTGRVITFVEGMIPPTVYYSRVGLELGKIIARGQKMTIPDVATFQKYYEPLIHAARNPSSAMKSFTQSGPKPESLLNSIMNVSGQQLITFGIMGAEILGFFTVGEIIGRMKIVGYRGAHVHGDAH